MNCLRRKPGRLRVFPCPRFRDKKPGRSFRSPGAAFRYSEIDRAFGQKVSGRFWPNPATLFQFRPLLFWPFVSVAILFAMAEASKASEFVVRSVPIAEIAEIAISPELGLRLELYPVRLAEAVKIINAAPNVSSQLLAAIFVKFGQSKVQADGRAC